MKTAVFLLLVLCMPVVLKAQKKHALIIGIDNYYERRGVVSKNISLKGCVNDAMAIKGLLMNRFGFKENEIQTVYNEEATKDNILSKFISLANVCGKDDVVFIYYAGHGVTLWNSYSPKDGKNQGILASDLYSKTSSLIRDNDLKTFVNKMIDKKAVVTFINDCCFAGGLTKAAPIREIDTVGRMRSIRYVHKEHEDEEDREIEEAMKDTLLSRALPATNVDIKDKTIVQRPEDKKNSRFLFFAAATDYEESNERLDLNNIPHGAFTAAFIHVMKKMPVSATSTEILNNINKELTRQYIFGLQKPLMYGDPNRYNMNLLGSNLPALSNKTLVSVTAINQNQIILSGGASAGLARGNTLAGTGSKKAIKLRVDALAGLTAAKATITYGSAASIKVGDQFEVTGWHTVSLPRLKVYLPASPSLHAFNRFVSQVIQPAIYDEQYKDYNQVPGDYSFNIYFSKDKWQSIQQQLAPIDRGTYKVKSYKTINESKASFAVNSIDFKKLKQEVSKLDYFIYLPLPAEVSARLKSNLASNQNIQFVNNPSEADVSFYATVERATGGLIFLVSKEIIGEKFLDGGHMRERHSHRIEGYNIKQDAVNKLAVDLQNLLLLSASYKGWLNEYARSTNR
ncbi:caspase family protein [Aridibaculum aurantiacum]|uniref:caspase family protein n=1 Tax=Aridibaculum aurantiacum TaxID=2810307 RepID=UPI001A975D0D|nr:caspase family protein [Aridibaculum aurantiacum]